jgi:preprotein translocase subunit SecG
MLLAEQAWYHPVYAVLFAFVACLLILVVLLQRGRGGGLAGAFGGAGGGQSAFGAKTGDFLTWVTVGIAALFLLAAVALNYAFSPSAPPLMQQAPRSPQPGPAPVSQHPVTPFGETA